MLASAEALTRVGVAVRILSASPPSGATMRSIYAINSAIDLLSSGGRRPSADQLQSVDALHLHTIFPSISPQWLSDNRPPAVWTQHNFRPYCSVGTFFDGDGLCTRCLDQRTSSPAVLRRCADGSVAKSALLARRYRWSSGVDTALQSAELIVAPSERARSLHLEAGHPGEKVQVWPHFVPDQLVPRGPLPRDGRRGWLFIGRLSPEKGVARLVERWPADVPLTIVGDGSQRGDVAVRARGKSIEMTGNLEPEAVAGLMQRSAGLVFPSLTFETFGLVYIEALSAGLPVAAFAPTVVSDMVRDDRTGMVLDWNSDLRSQLAACAEVFPGLSSRCREVFFDRYSEAAYVRRAISAYDGLIGQADR